MKKRNEGFSPTVKELGFESLSYSIIESEGEFGISVACHSSGERIDVSGITNDIHAAEKLKHILSENIVFPANVLEILDDLLAEGI